ncbi:MAG: hypothetical protein CVV64_10275 [Candidatus Wallbacteria bacterium HGW-Wallbacteria-1]|jgi:hypothetical protein|uniref:Cohesin domain-containing protein n=1 Tax=Candidatus Wallbacteria bacterium HGW-Wallbacteria-1 TaxID=2013854 RepID=A0A2N1PPU0_9BACT|nr:MAG: hypothetical protein CVV64_10275 [Candidatus Wallbacteria bacterium HGW-Wallbacteria-1]
MKKNFQIKLLPMMKVLIFIVITTVVSMLMPATGQTLSPAISGIQYLNNDITIPVMLDQASDLYGIAVDIVYDPDIMEIIDMDNDTANGIQPAVYPGTIFGSASSNLIARLQDSNPGRLVIGFSLDGQIQGVQIISQNVATLRFRPLMVGKGRVNVENLRIIASTGTEIDSIAMGVSIEISDLPPNPPTVSGLDILNASPFGVSSLSNDVTISANCRISWFANDTDGTFQTDLYWSKEDLTNEQVEAALTQSSEGLTRINSLPISDNSLSQLPVHHSYDWNVISLFNITELFPSGLESPSAPIYIYATVRDMLSSPKAITGQIARSASRMILSLPPESDTSPLFAFENLSIGVVQASDQTAEFTFRCADDSAEPLNILFFYAERQDILRILPCRNPSAGAQIQGAIIPGIATDPAQTSVISAFWDISDIPDASYFILALIDDGKHLARKKWSDFPVRVSHGNDTNTAPSFEWLAPSMDQAVITDTSDPAISFRVRDDDGDKLKIELFRNSVTTEREGLIPIGISLEIQTSSSDTSWILQGMTLESEKIPPGRHYILARITQTELAVPSVGSWSIAPVIIRGFNLINGLSIGTPSEDTGNPGRMQASISFLTTMPAVAHIIYGLRGIPNITVSSLNIGQEHIITIDDLEPGQTYYFKVRAETNGKVDEMDNQGNLYTLSIPQLTPASAKWVKGRAANNFRGIVKAYLARGDNDHITISRPCMTLVNPSGDWMIDIGQAVSRDSRGTLMIPSESDTLRVEFMAGDGSNRFFRDISLSGINDASTPDNALTPAPLWADGQGVEISGTTLEISVPLVPGFNLVSAPIQTAVPLSASSILDSIGTEALAIYFFNSASGRYKSLFRLNDSFIGEDFSVNLAKGFFIRSNAYTNLRITGEKKNSPEYIPVVRGFNMLAVSFARDFPASSDTDLTAIDVLRQLGTDGQAVYAFRNGRYELVIRIGEDYAEENFYSPSGNFRITQGTGYFIKTSNNSTFLEE